MNTTQQIALPNRIALHNMTDRLSIYVNYLVTNLSAGCVVLVIPIQRKEQKTNNSRLSGGDIRDRTRDLSHEQFYRKREKMGHKQLHNRGKEWRKKISLPVLKPLQWKTVKRANLIKTKQIKSIGSQAKKNGYLTTKADDLDLMDVWKGHGMLWLLISLSP